MTRTRNGVPLLLVLFGAVVLGASASRPDDGDETPLRQSMEKLEDPMRTLRRSVRAAERNDESLALVAAMQEAVLAGKSMQPAMLAQVPEAERAAFLRDYRKEMARLLMKFLELEIALLDGDNATARQLYGDLKELEEKGHERFTVEEGGS